MLKKWVKKNEDGVYPKSILSKHKKVVYNKRVNNLQEQF